MLNPQLNPLAGWLQTASGAVACQLLDALHPGSVNLSKARPRCAALLQDVWMLGTASCCTARQALAGSASQARAQVDFNAVNEYDWINNYKVLQAAFNKLHINKVLVCSSTARARRSVSLRWLPAANRGGQAGQGATAGQPGVHAVVCLPSCA